MSSIRVLAQRFAFGALALTSYACDDGEAESLRSQKCDEICAHFEMCDDRTDETGCQDKCKAETFRSDTYFELKADCATGLTCNRLEEQDESEDLNDCIRRSFREEPSNEDAQSLCTGLGNKLADCDSNLDADAVRNACEPIAITLSEDYLAGSESCADQRCADVEACLEDLADDYNTRVSVFSGDID